MTAEQRAELETIARSTSRPHREVRHAKALLMAGDGVANAEIAERVGVGRGSVLAWRSRFEADGVERIGRVAKGRGRKRSISQEAIEAVVQDTLHSTPPAETHWSCRSMAAHAGMSKATVQKIWSSRGIKPHLVRTFKLSNDARFEEKLVDVVGLYNYGTHNHPNVKAWLAKHPRFHLHFTPTSSSWLNLVERWFRELTDRAIRRGVFPSVDHLIAAIDDYLDAHNQDPKPFTWTASAASIIEKVERGRVALRQLSS
jgi:transposase